MKANKFQSKNYQNQKEKRITHLFLNEKFLRKIPRLENPHTLAVMYLQNNEITEINSLENVEKLTSLYLQQNRIQKMENLEKLKKLKKLYLGQNMISVVENLENLTSLTELYLEKQTLQNGNALCFDPRSTQAMANTLQVLNISHNKIQTISSLSSLRCLKVLNASYNDLNDIDEICNIIKEWFYLDELSLSNNPICKERLYQENIIANAYCLQVLDSKEISDHTRKFIKRINEERRGNGLQKTKHKYPELLKKYSSAIQKAVSINVLKESLDEDIFDEKNAVFVPWKTCISSKCNKTKNVSFVSVPKPQRLKKPRVKIPTAQQKISQEKYHDIKI